MSLAETNQIQENSTAIAVAAPEFAEQKNHVGPDEAARLAVIGSFNAQLLARKRMLQVINSAPGLDFDGQDVTLRQEIEDIRAQRDATITAGVRNPGIYSRPQLRLVSPPSETIETVEPEVTAALSTMPESEPAAGSEVEAGTVVPETVEAETTAPESLDAKLARLEAFALTYTALAQEIGASLDELRGRSLDDILAAADRLTDASESITAATDTLIIRSNDLVDAAENPVIPESDAGDNRLPVEISAAAPAQAGSGMQRPAKSTHKKKATVKTPPVVSTPPVDTVRTDKAFEAKLSTIRLGGGRIGYKPTQRNRRR